MRLPLRTTLLALFLASPSPASALGNAPPHLIPLPSPHNGISLGLNWNADAYDNLAGGVKRGYATDSVLSFGLGLDTGALGWWRGGVFSLGLRGIWSTHPSEYAGDLQTLSNLDAPNRRQISAFWYSQSIGPALVRAGIMDLNSFFDDNEPAELFANASFGIMPSITANVPTATYPNSAWGVMAQIGAEQNGWLLGVFQGNPQQLSTALKGGEMLIAERDWRPAGGTQLGIGTWYRRAPAASGLPTSDWGAYVNLQQALPDHPGASAFVQLGTSPGQVNTVPAYLGTGVVFHDVSRAVSALGIGMARAWIRGLAAETSLEATATIPLFDGEAILQPDAQYIFHPSGIHPNAFVVGLRLHLALY